MNVIKCNTIEEAWQSTFNLILKKGKIIYDEDQELKEITHVTLDIKAPEKVNHLNNSQDNVMEKWMAENFTEVKRMPRLQNSWSYGWRLYNYQGINQIEWVINKLKKKPESKSATISMLQGAGMEPYIPCVSLLDFKIRDKELILTVTCRSLDFGKKAFHNLTNLAEILKKVARSLDISNYHLIVYVFSAHIYIKDNIYNKNK